MPHLLHALKIHPDDNVVVAAVPLKKGQQIEVADQLLMVPPAISPIGAKLAIVPLPTGSKVLKFGESIGSATADIAVGDYIHTHNLASDYIPTPENGTVVLC